MYNMKNEYYHIINQTSIGMAYIYKVQKDLITYSQHIQNAWIFNETDAMILINRLGLIKAIMVPINAA